MTQPNPNQRPFTEAEIEAQRHTKHFHEVFGFDALKRSKSQQYIVDWLEAHTKAPVFIKCQRTGYDPIDAAINEGQRILSKRILLEIEKSSMSQTQKPTVKKG
jgi:hypothetical protein